MDLALFSAKPYDRRFFEAAADGLSLRFFEAKLGPDTAPLAEGSGAVCAFVNDDLGADTLAALASRGVRCLALRCAGFNHVDLAAAKAHGIRVVRVPGYSPHAVAEHALALIMALNRKTHRAYARVREGNFALEGLLGFDLHGRTVAVVGTGQIGAAFAGIMLGLGCRVLAFDPRPNPDLAARGVRYGPLEEALSKADVISLHCPLTPATRHLIDGRALARLKPGAMLINTGRGALVDARALIDALKTGRLGSVGLDVYEEEAALFFEDLSGEILQDDVFARLLTFPNVLITGHQGFFTRDALEAIARTTVANVRQVSGGGACENEVKG